ncbi:hypothetical protein C8R47DRAFT_1087082 [Mycena vitilis]|nr:hypothetical protein C8R47DRAFT_1087082 [Mycena vitilis]
MSTNPATNLVPAIGSAVVPTIPADTKGPPDTQKSTAPVDVGPNVPESFTQESEDGELKEGGAVVKTGKDSMPQNLADNIPSADGEPQLTPPRPPFAPVMSNLSTQAQAGSIYSSASTATLNSDNISTMVHTGGTHSPHPVRPLGESKVFDSHDLPAAYLQSFIDATANPPFSSSDASLATGAHGAGALPTMSPEVLKPERVADGFAGDARAEFVEANSPLLGSTSAPAVAPDAPTATGTIAQQGSASLISSNPNDKFPADTPTSSLSTATTPTTPPTASHANNLNADEVAVQEDGAPESGGEDDEGGHKKPKLMQRLKEKMHIGHGHS